MYIEWTKCTGGVWCELYRLDLDHKYLKGVDGVYILWCGTSEKSVIAVGNGPIRKQLKAECEDIAVKAFEQQGLYVTWAEVPMLKRKAVEIFLNSELKPKIVKEVPKGKPVSVNLPW